MSAEVRVLHRLALGVEPVDAVLGGLIGLAVHAGREVPGWGVLPLEAVGTGRFKLRHGPGIGQHVVVRFDDPRHRYVPRRFGVPIWTVRELADREESGQYVPVRSRMLRPRLLPGAAYPVSRGTTGIRGRVVFADERPVRWHRVTATDPAGGVMARAHGDGNGEFLLTVGGDGGRAPLPPAELDLRLIIRADITSEPPRPEEDPLLDLPIETVTRSSAPPLTGDLDNPLLRGELVPAGYVASTTRPPIRIDVGRITPLTFTFTP